MEYVRKHRIFKLVITESIRNYLILELKYHTIKKFSDKLLGLELKITQVLMTKAFYLGLSILEFSKIIIHEF